MKSLFVKILVWFLVTTAIIMAAFSVATALTFSQPRARQTPFAMLISLQIREARHAYETGGREALLETMRRFREATGIRGIFTDRNGRDLVTGEDHSVLVRRAARHSIFPISRGRRFIVGHEDENGRYWYFLLFPRRRWALWLFHAQYLWVLGLAVLLCYALAAHLTSPVRRLQKAVDRFGRGDLDARARSDRADELGELARTFDRMAERIQTLLAAERRLLLDISHELRSPLARLSVAAELARSDEQREAALNQIQKESDRMNALVGELLQVTRAEGDPSALRLEQVRLDELLDSLVEDCSIEAKARGCSLQLNARPIEIRGDGELLRRALENMIRNAIRFAPEESKVEINAEMRGAVATIRVRDYGPGVPDEALPRIFDPFYRVEADRSRVSGGVGLGLAIARRAVDLHKGKLRARNATPGLLVEIELPAAR
jgi:two-component system sensor histidine kinase CpxA